MYVLCILAKNLISLLPGQRYSVWQQMQACLQLPVGMHVDPQQPPLCRAGDSVADAALAELARRCARPLPCVHGVVPVYLLSRRGDVRKRNEACLAELVGEQVRPAPDCVHS